VTHRLEKPSREQTGFRILKTEKLGVARAKFSGDLFNYSWQPCPS